MHPGEANAHTSETRTSAPNRALLFIAKTKKQPKYMQTIEQTNHGTFISQESWQHRI